MTLEGSSPGCVFTPCQAAGPAPGGHDRNPELVRGCLVDSKAIRVFCGFRPFPCLPVHAARQLPRARVFSRPATHAPPVPGCGASSTPDSMLFALSAPQEPCPLLRQPGTARNTSAQGPAPTHLLSFLSTVEDADNRCLQQYVNPRLLSTTSPCSLQNACLPNLHNYPARRHSQHSPPDGGK